MSILGNELLIGEKTRLAPIWEANIDALAKWFTEDVWLMRNLNPRAIMPMGHAEEEAWLEAVSKDEQTYNFAIKTLDDDVYIGGCSLFEIDQRAQSAIMGIQIGHADYRGKGYGTDAHRVLLRYAFMDLNLWRVGLYVYGYNAPAIRSYEKIGYQVEGRLREAMRRDGQWHDSVAMGILRPEWQARYYPEAEE